MASKRYVSEYFAMRSLQTCFVLWSMSRSDTPAAIEVLLCFAWVRTGDTRMQELQARLPQSSRGP